MFTKVSFPPHQDPLCAQLGTSAGLGSLGANWSLYHKEIRARERIDTLLKRIWLINITRV